MAVITAWLLENSVIIARVGGCLSLTKLASVVAHISRYSPGGLEIEKVSFLSWPGGLAGGLLVVKLGAWFVWRGWAAGTGPARSRETWSLFWLCCSRLSAGSVGFGSHFASTAARGLGARWALVGALRGGPIKSCSSGGSAARSLAQE
jgi:hypothetical protein